MHLSSDHHWTIALLAGGASDLAIPKMAFLRKPDLLNKLGNFFRIFAAGITFNTTGHIDPVGAYLSNRLGYISGVQTSGQDQRLGYTQLLNQLPVKTDTATTIQMFM